MRLIDADALKADIMLQAAILREVKGKSKLVRISDIVESEFITQIDKMPTIEERKTGKWIDYTDEGYVECPFCHSATNCEGNKEELHYCFSCGARMESEK